MTCLFARAGFRKQGISRVLARAAVAFARERGARAVEAYPIITKDVIAEELHVGTPSVFADAGLVEVSHPTAACRHAARPLSPDLRPHLPALADQRGRRQSATASSVHGRRGSSSGSVSWAWTSQPPSIGRP